MVYAVDDKILDVSEVKQYAEYQNIYIHQEDRQLAVFNIYSFLTNYLKEISATNLYELFLKKQNNF